MGCTSQRRFLCGRAAKLFFCFYNCVMVIPCFFQSLLATKSKPLVKENPTILLCCFASLGDVLLASFIISALKGRWPCAKIGFVCSPGALPILDIVKKVDFVHTVPYWMKKNKIQSIFSLMYHSWFVYPRTVKEIKGLDYDISFELHPFFPNTIPLAKRAKIPYRIGFTSGGYEILLTNPVDLPKKIEYLPRLYARLLSSLGEGWGELSADLQISASEGFCKEPYLVLHMGTSDPRKEWNPQHWHEVAKTLKEQGHTLVFTGKGAHDMELFHKASLGDLGVNLIDRLDCKEFASLINRAKALLSVDSIPIHLAAALKVPFIGLYLYNEGVEFWLPDSSTSFLLVSSQCFRRNGKENHPRAIYLEEVKPQYVLAKMSNLLDGMFIL